MAEKLFGNVFAHLDEITPYFRIQGTGAYLAETLHFYRKESPEMGSCRKQSTQLQMGAEMTN